MIKPTITTLGLTLTFLSACGRGSNANSKLDGHYENATASSVSKFQGQQFVIPEYSDSRGVILSLPYVTGFNKASAIAEILKTSIKTLWIVVPQDFRGGAESSVFAELRRLAGSSFSKVVVVPQRQPGSLTIWARDWSPLTAKTPSGQSRLLDFNYYPNRQTDDFTAQSFVTALPFERVSIPVYNEGGNFMSNSDGVCLMTTRVTDANKQKSFENDMILNAEEIKSYYAEYAGCTSVHIFPRIPYEGTGHIDMWAKFLDNDTVIVSEIRDEILNLPNSTKTDRAKYKEIQTYLDARAEEITKLGYSVVRLPMPAPVFNGGANMFRSYTNSLLVNGTAFVPRYLAPAKEGLSVEGKYIDSVYLGQYEEEVLQAYKNLGWSSKWVNSDDTIAIGGAIHCTSMQVPN